MPESNILPFVPDPSNAVRMKCAVEGCDRIAYDGDELCGECREAQEASRKVVWRGSNDSILPDVILPGVIFSSNGATALKPLTEATTCTRCGDAIPAGEYRVAALAASPVGVTRKLEFCADCIAVMDEFVIPNNFKRDIEREAARSRRQPTPGEDAMDTWRQAGLSEATAGAAITVTTEPRSHESVRKETLSNFLADRTRSWGKLKPTTRQAATLYVEGKNQNEIARQLRVDQGTVSRMLQQALRTALAS